MLLKSPKLLLTLLSNCQTPCLYRNLCRNRKRFVDKLQRSMESPFIVVTRCLVLCLLLAPAPAESQGASPAKVIVYKVKKAPWSDSIEALGTLRANETVSLTSTVTDIITKINFEDGQRVEKGFVLAEMTNAEESAVVQEMTARVGEAKRQLSRLKQLPNAGAVSESLYDERERPYKAANAQLEAMRSRLTDRLIVAPFKGVVGLRTMSEGALVNPGDPIVTLTDDSVMKLDFTVPSLFLRALEIGLPVKARSRSFPDEVFEGTVTGIDSQVDPVTRSITVRALIQNSTGKLKPGLLMSVNLAHGFREALILPEESLVPSGKEQYVFVANSSKTPLAVDDLVSVEKRQIEIASRDSGKVEVVSGIRDGEFVITHGTMSARPGTDAQVRAIQKDGEGIGDILTRMESE